MSSNLPSTSRSLPIALILAREAVMAPIRDMLAESNITEQHWRVLRMLNEHGPQDASTLARRSGLLAPSLSRIVAAMEANGHLVREPDLEDRRKQRLAMTE